ncbi:MAG: hypothetical protein AAGB10_15605 [Pseudomonadota bacterium]
MKKVLLTAAALTFAAPAAFAGNVEVFVAPEEPVIEEPIGGSNAGFVIPLVALVIIAAAIVASDD